MHIIPLGPTPITNQFLAFQTSHPWHFAFSLLYFWFPCSLLLCSIVLLSVAQFAVITAYPQVDTPVSTTFSFPPFSIMLYKCGHNLCISFVRYSCSGCVIGVHVSGNGGDDVRLVHQFAKKYFHTYLRVKHQWKIAPKIMFWWHWSQLISYICETCTRALCQLSANVHLAI